MSQNELLVFLVGLALLLSTALTLGRIANRLGVPAVVGELLAGVVLGPSLLGAVAPDVTGWLWSEHGDSATALDTIAQVGMLLFVGVAAAQLDIRMLRRRRRTVAAISALALLLPLVSGVVTGYLLPDRMLGPDSDRLRFALLVGVVMAVSAIPVIAKTLTDLGMLHRNVGQLTVAAAAGDDIVAWLMLSVVAGMSAPGFDRSGIWLSALRVVGFLLAAAVVGRPLVRTALRLADRSTGSGPAIATVVAVILAGSAATLALGLEAALGAFVVGVLISATRTLDVQKLAPLRAVTLAVFAPVFLATAGLHMDVSVLANPGTLLVAVVMCTVAAVGKFAGGYLGARFSGMTRWEGLALGAGLNARGAVEVVVAAIGLRIGVLSETMYTLVVLVAVVTSVMAPTILRWAMQHNEVESDEQLRRAELAAWSGDEYPTPEQEPDSPPITRRSEAPDLDFRSAEGDW